jgi:hypothetical protein
VILKKYGIRPKLDAITADSLFDIASASRYSRAAILLEDGGLSTDDLVSSTSRRGRGRDRDTIQHLLNHLRSRMGTRVQS